MICCCALAGTRACANCNFKAEYDYRPNTISIPYTPVDTEEKRLQEIEIVNRAEQLTGYEQYQVSDIVNQLLKYWRKEND